jgi:hypothetical protein
VAVPYDVGYVWRYGNESVEHDQFTSAMANDSIKKYVRTTLPKLVDNSKSKTPKFMVEKSVPNTLRVGFLYSIYPEAKYIHLIRDGRAVTESSIRLWEQPADNSYLLKKLKYFPWSNYKYAWWYLLNMLKGKLSGERGQHIWGPRYIGIDKDALELTLPVVCARQWRRCVEIAKEQLKLIPAAQVMEVRYEDLMSDPSCLERVCDFIEISDKMEVMDYFKLHADASRMDVWKERLPKESLDMIMKEIEETLKGLEYPLEGLNKGV